MGTTIRAGSSLLLSAILPLLGLPGVAQAGSPAPAAQGQLVEPSSTPSLGEALKPSSPEQLALANHLRKSGAIFYGAYWCTHCFRQKNLFGQQAGARLPYVECAKDQAGSDKCNAVNIKAYPTWVLGSERREGLQSLEALASWSGFSGFGASGNKVQLLSPAAPAPKAP